MEPLSRFIRGNHVRRHLRRTAAVGVVLLAATASVATAAMTPASGQLQEQTVVVSDNPADWTPQVLDGRVNTVLQIGNDVFAGGTFRQVAEADSTNVIDQPFLFSFDADTGAINSRFQPSLNGRVESLAAAPDGKSLIVGGDFTTFDNAPAERLVSIDLMHYRADKSFKGSANDVVLEVVVQGGDLYVAGRFTQVTNADRSGMARLDPGSGAVDPTFDIPFTDPPRYVMSVPEFSINPAGTRLVAIGNFSRVAGQDRVQVAMLDLSTTPVTVVDWQTDEYPVFVPNSTLTWCQSNFPSYLRDVDFSPDGEYFVIVTTGANRPNRLCDTVSRWETSASGSGQQPSWVNWTGGDSIISVVATGAAVYIGGHQQYVNNPYVDQDCGVCPIAGGAVPREGLAALDPLNGLPYTWDPGRSRGLGVMQFLATADGLWLGSDTDRLGGETHPKLGFFPVAGGTSVPPSVPYALPGTLYNLDAATGSVARRSYDTATLGTSETVPLGVRWRKARGVFALDNQLYYGWANGTFRTRSFDGASVGPASKINLRGLDVAPEPHTFFIPGTTIPVPSITDHLKAMTGAFFADGRMYYSVKGDPRLYYRYFTAESRVVGANVFVASTGDGVKWKQVRGMTMASGELIYATRDGNLHRIAFDGAPTGPSDLIGGPTIDGIDWTSRGFFAFD